MKRLWLNPFEKLAGSKALLLGMLLMLLGAFLASCFNARFDGVLDLHFGYGSSMAKPFTDQLISWLCLCLVFYVSALVCGARPRPVDIMGTFALARAPFTWTPIVNCTGFVSYLSEKISPTDRQLDLSAGETVILVILLCLVLLSLVWMTTLYFKAYKTCSNLKGNTLAISFIIGLLIAEILSVYLIRGPLDY